MTAEAGKAPSRAEVAAPKRKQQSSFLGEQANQPVGAAKNMKDEKKFMLSFSVPLSWHKRFKMTAAAGNMKMIDLLMESFEAWQEKNSNK
jgi:hypothetical protein